MKILIDIERSLTFNKIVFWKPNRRGYTQKLYEAGRYTQEEAKQVTDDDRDGLTVMIDESTAKALRGDELYEGDTGGFLL